MNDYSQNVLTRPDTLLGVCQAIGEDFGFNPLILRLAFALPLFWNPYVAVAAYLALGAIVAVTRWIAPNPSVAKPAAPVETAEPQSEKAAEQPDYALAA